MLDEVQRSAIQPGRDEHTNGATAMSTRKRTTAADIAAAVALGAIDPAQEFGSGDPAETTEPTQPTTQPGAVVDYGPVVLSATTHECGIPGCRHGSAHGAVTQPDRQLKLATECGAVARMTASALARAGGTITDGHGHPFAVAARRAYARR